MRSISSRRTGDSHAQLCPPTTVMVEHRWVCLSVLALACFALFGGSKILAITPAPDGGYANGNTAEGTNALHGLTTGKYNTVTGLTALFTDTSGSFNTAIGVNTLFANNGNWNTATGTNALYRNRTGSYNTAIGAQALFNNLASFNTAIGLNALYSNTTGSNNTAIGFESLFYNTTGPFNTAVGNMALFNNTTGDRSTAMGESALLANTTGASNTAIGVSALRNNVTGNFNTAVGHDSLVANQVSDNTAVGFRAAYSNTTGYSNTAIGNGALIANDTGWENTAIGDGALASNTASFTSTAIGVRALGGRTQGAFNTAIGYEAGYNVDGFGNVCIGAGVHGQAGTLGTTWIANIYSTNAGNGRAVFVTSDNMLGTLTSSRRYKDDIRPMVEASEAIFSLKPVSFRYKKEIDPARCLSFGLIAEEVAEVDPDLVTLDGDGKPETVRYEAVNAMLLNEFLKEHRKVEEQARTAKQQEARLAKQEATNAELKTLVTQQQDDFKATIAQQQKQIEVLTAGLRKISLEVEQSKPATKVANQ